MNIEPPKKAVNVVSENENIALIAYNPKQPHTPVPTKLIAELETALADEGTLRNREERFLKVAPVARRIIDLKPTWHQNQPKTKDV